jgi:hypothetical protein
MGGKGNFGKSLAQTGRAYRVQAEKGRLSAGVKNARGLDGKRLGEDAASTIAAMEKDRRERRFHKGAAKAQGPSDDAPAKDGSDDDDEEVRTAADDDGDDDQAKAEAEAQRIQDAVYLRELQQAMRGMKEAVAGLAARVHANEVELKT